MQCSRNHEQHLLGQQVQQRQQRRQLVRRIHDDQRQHGVLMKPFHPVGQRKLWQSYLDNDTKILV